MSIVYSRVYVGVWLRTCDLEGCERKYYAKGFCLNHYNSWRWRNDPDFRERQTKYAKIYHRSEKGKQYHREYSKRDYVKAKFREYQKTHNTHQLEDFFDSYNRNKTWQLEGVEKMSEIYAEISCGLSGKESCELQERILAQAEDRIGRKKSWRRRS